MRINTNIAALNSYNQLKNTQGNLSKSLSRLSSGKRINGASDDAAGLAISEKMTAQVRGLSQAQRNAQDGISMIQTAEGALKESHSILQRMRELSVQASNDTNTAEDRAAIGDELVELRDELDRISDTTSFNGKGLLSGDLSTSLDTTTSDVTEGTEYDSTVVSNIDVSGAKADETYTFSYDSSDLTLERSDGVSQTIDLSSYTPSGDTQTLNFNELGVSVSLTGTAGGTDALGGVLDADTIQTEAGNSSAELLIGSNGTADEKLSVSFSKMASDTIGEESGDKISDVITGSDAVDSATKADHLVKVLDGALNDVSEQRAKFGAAQNRLEHTINNLNTAQENLTAAESRISDVDMAQEMMSFTKNQILSQAGTAMMAQANQLPQGVLQLLG